MSEKIESDGWSTQYYEIPPEAKELQDLIEHKQMNFSRGNIFKAAYRLGEKQGTDAIYDLKKIIWYAQREINRLSPPDGMGKVLSDRPPLYTRTDGQWFRNEDGTLHGPLPTATTDYS